METQMQKVLKKCAPISMTFGLVVVRVENATQGSGFSNKCIYLLGFFFYLYGDVTIASEEIVGLCSALRAFEQGEIFIVLHLL
jgi:uncharacterized membrane protein YiaA